MANEATIIESPTKFMRFTVAEATAIPAGTILVLSDPNTAIASSADNGVFAGIAWEEFKGGEGLTEISAAVNGVWDITSTDAAITAGGLVSIGGANLVLAADTDAVIKGETVGKALESCTGTETIRVAVGY